MPITKLVAQDTGGVIALKHPLIPWLLSRLDSCLSFPYQALSVRGLFAHIVFALPSLPNSLEDIVAVSAGAADRHGSITLVKVSKGVAETYDIVLRKPKTIGLIDRDLAPSTNK